MPPEFLTTDATEHVPPAPVLRHVIDKFPIHTLTDDHQRIPYLPRHNGSQDQPSHQSRIFYMAAKTLSVGDHVAWNTSQGTTTGRVKKKFTRPTKIKTHKVAASKDNPHYLVETDESHKLAAHKPSGLRKKSS